jgi:ATP-dependent DNA helicase RecG
MCFEFPYSAAYLKIIPGGAGQVGLGGKVGETPGKTPVKTPVKTPAKILVFLQANPDSSLAEVAAAIGKSVSAVERASARLVREGKLRFVGPRKGGRWEVLK